VDVKVRATLNWANSERELKKRFAARASKLLTRLLDLRSAPTLGDLPPSFRPHPLVGDRRGQFAIDVVNGLRVVFIALDPVPKSKDGSINWRQVDHIEIIFIGDYH